MMRLNDFDADNWMISPPITIPENGAKVKAEWSPKINSSAPLSKSSHRVFFNFFRSSGVSSMFLCPIKQTVILEKDADREHRESVEKAIL